MFWKKNVTSLDTGFDMTSAYLKQMVKDARVNIRNKLSVENRCSRTTCEGQFKPPERIKCKTCIKQWCCLECCIEDNGLDHEHYDLIDDSEETVDQRDIVCCHCSNKKRSWEERDD